MKDNEKIIIDSESLNDNMMIALKKSIKFINSDKQKTYKYEGGKKI